MTLSVDAGSVTMVHLEADGWHHARDFQLGESPWGDGALWYEFVELLEDGRPGDRMAGPVSRIVGVRAAPDQARVKPMNAEWCGLCEDASRAGRMVTEDGVRVPCPRCHPDPEAWEHRQQELREARTRLRHDIAKHHAIPSPTPADGHAPEQEET